MWLQLAILSLYFSLPAGASVTLAAMDSPLVSPPQPLPATSRAYVAWRLTAIDRAYAREMLTPILLGVLVIVLVLSVNFVYAGINSVINQGVDPGIMLRVFLLAIPGFSVQGVAIGVILGVCLILSRAVRDNEVMALRAGGASVIRILMPFWFMAVLASAADYALLEYVAPRTNVMVKKTLQKLMHTSATQLIEGDKYFHVDKYYFYVQDVQDKVLHNVMIYARNTGDFTSIATATYPSVIIAREAHEDPQKPNRWILSDVVTTLYNDDGSFSKQMRMKEFALNVGQQLSQFWAEDKGPFEMTKDELGKQINAMQNAAFDAGKVREMRVQYYRHFSMPAACFVMALLAAPLSLKFARHGSFAGLVCAFGLAFVYQVMDSFFSALGNAGRLEPMVSAWSTNAILIVFGLLLLWRER